MSSSNRIAQPCEAAIVHNEKPAGPVRLPMKNKESFIRQFNRLYGKSGIFMRAVEKPDPEQPSIFDETNR